MSLLILVLLAVIAFLLSRIRFLLTAYGDDLADLRKEVAALRQAKPKPLPVQAPAPTTVKKSISADEIIKATDRININSISKTSLQRIPSIGATAAQRVIDARPYTDLNQLDSVKGLTKAQRDSLKSLLTV
ncbi:hypothetical protein R50072_06120 [Simiduia litorea]|uniref:ComEA family DNA-binding protein n=1 Tax=Simiduia litorea TaxID=1435348 RepID=UPI0036F20959